MLLVLSSFAFTGRAFSAAEVQALGGPRAEGIFARRLSIQHSGSGVLLQWAGAANVRLQKATNLATGNWQDVQGTPGASQFTETVLTGSEFFRLVGP